MIRLTKSMVGFLLVAAWIGGLAGEAAAQGRTKIRYALGDVISIDELPLLIAWSARRRGGGRRSDGVQEREVATQAVINGQSDVGQGTPYAALQKVTVLIRFFSS
jgi:NitT/TauT family transport system substrate-binding protein